METTTSANLNLKNLTNSTPLTALQWTSETIDNQRPALVFCILATLTHAIFWIQVCFIPAYRHRTMQWLYVYLITDQLLILRFFFSYIVHMHFYQSASNALWTSFICYLNAGIDNYLNVLAIYVLLAINICRYFQIVHNRNVYQKYPYFLLLSHIILYLTPIIIFAVQLIQNWAQLVFFLGDTCNISFVTKGTQIFNVLYGYAVPILLNIMVILLNLFHVHLKTYRRRAQIRMSARDKYHRSLVTQFLLFYIIWLALWSPDVLAYQFTTGDSSWTAIASILNYIGITLDPIVIGALDARIRKGWTLLWRFVKRIYSDVPTRVAPATTGPKEETRF